ncbi:alpha/beta hydrolase [Streptomyces sp. LP05-1]|uniref:Alpha/beta hydrolase n=1 Tax=Streptomyces pyxinae TaxID=2970734 RepID=A0ABT2CDY9_9ACTN|nr:alpha/beta hydrolase [Streptomyces sp. LP05-1]MCS0635619.1 alpha/beta hydrolase [Streptomyces sp. LP05-1]
MQQTTCAGLFTRRFGPPVRPGGPTAVLVHGLGLSGRYFAPLARRLAARGATVFVPDLPGNARSRSAARRMPDIGQAADALARWYQALALGPSLLVANSVGCQVAAALVAHHPDTARHMVLVGPALDPRVSTGGQAGRLLADIPREPLSLLAVAASDYLTTGPLRFTASFRHALRDATTLFEAHLARVRVPTLVVRGAGDTLAPAPWVRRVARTVGDGHTAVIEGAAHAAHYSAPGALSALIGDFTALHRGGPRPAPDRGPARHPCC